MALRAWPRRSLRHGHALGGARFVFGPADGPRHVPDLRGIPDGADTRAELGPADSVRRALAIYFRGVRAVCRDGRDLGLLAAAGNPAPGVPADADPQARLESGRARALQPRLAFLH